MNAFHHLTLCRCERGGRLDKAMEVFSNMQAAGVKPDDITFSTLVSTVSEALLSSQAVRHAHRIADGVSQQRGRSCFWKTL